MPEDMAQLAQQPDLPVLYFNGFQIALTNSDVSLVMMYGGAPKLLASMSFTTAKTLHLSLGEVVEALERATDHDIMSMKHVAENLEKIETPESERNG